ncbi:hypothetical protein [Winogradskyella sp. A3E31]|uniref:hypothetical protein n=1 Tax=Winogradskyella sp. A3E31 TaxID=3349637 RepID=UPI00398B9BEB
MKFKLTYIFIFILFVSCKQNKLDVATDFKSNRVSEYIYSSERDLNPINESWIQKDSLFLSELTNILKNDDSDVTDILKIDENDRKIALGFGYEQIEASMGKGYAGIYYNLILKEGEVISYEFTPNFPSNKDLTERYLKMYSGIFEINENILHKRYFNIEGMESPLKNINSDISLNENLRFLMTPFSGTRYGFSGGYSGSTFTNRAIFLEEYKSITSEVCLILMNSKNPGTRLMAIEYYMKNKSAFKNQDLIKNWIDKVYAELPTIETLEGCFVMHRDSKELVSEYVNRKN